MVVIVLQEASGTEADDKMVKKILDAIKADKYDKPMKFENNVEVRFDEKK